MVSDELLELLDDFLLECDERIATVESQLLTVEHLTATERPAVLAAVRRELHTLKGNSGMMGLADLQQLAHAMEDGVEALDPSSPQIDDLLVNLDLFKTGIEALRPADPGGASGPEPEPSHEGSVRVATVELDHLLDLAAELHAARNRLADSVAAGVAAAAARSDTEPAQRWRAVEEDRLRIEKILASLDERLRGLRMVPLRSVFSRLQRVVHDESAKSGKLVRLVTRGEETPLDSALVELAAETLGHLVRNAIVHGIESPNDRQAAGKPRQGTVLVEASLRSGRVEIEVLDDGAGIDREGLRAKARAHGFEIAEDAALHTLVFHPGLSIRQSVDTSSGRGIGTAAALETVHRYGGVIEVDSTPGVGSRFSLHLPLTVAVTETLIVSAGGERYALPISSVVETVAAPADSLQRRGGELVLEREGTSVPIVDLAAFFGQSPAAHEGGYAVVMSSEGKLRGLLVQHLGTLTKVVVTPLDPTLCRPTGVAGTTVTGSGDVMLILDPSALVVTSTGLAA